MPVSAFRRLMRRRSSSAVVYERCGESSGMPCTLAMTLLALALALALAKVGWSCALWGEATLSDCKTATATGRDSFNLQAASRLARGSPGICALLAGSRECDALPAGIEEESLGDAAAVEDKTEEVGRLADSRLRLCLRLGIICSPVDRKTISSVRQLSLNLSREASFASWEVATWQRRAVSSCCKKKEKKKK